MLMAFDKIVLDKEGEGMALIYDLSEYREQRKLKLEKKKLTDTALVRESEIAKVLLKILEIEKYLDLKSQTLSENKLSTNLDTVETFPVEYLTRLVLNSNEFDWIEEPELFRALIDEVRGREFFMNR